MKKKLLISLTFLLLINIQAQTQNVDSLINVVNSKDLTYIEKSKLYSRICDIYLYSDMDKSFEYANIGLSLAEKEKNLTYQSLFHEFLGKIYGFRAHSDSAVYHLNTALGIARKIKDKKLEGGINLCFGVIYAEENKFEKSLEHYIEALSIHESLDDKINIIIILGNIAGIHQTLNNFDRALYYLKKAEEKMDEIEESQYPIAQMNIYYKLGSLYNEKKDQEKELEYILKTLELARKYGNINFEVVSLHALSIIHTKNEEYEVALQYGKEALELAEKLGHRQLVLGTWGGLSDIYGTIGRWEDCEKAAMNALAIDSTDVHHNITLLYNMIWSNIHLGNKNKSEEYLEKYKVYWAQTNEKSLHESLTNMEVKYETEKKELRIAALEKEKQLYVWLGIVGVLFAITLGVILWQNIRNVNKEKQLIATRSVLDGEIGERTRIARDLHDRLSGNLAAVKIGLSDNKLSLRHIQDKLDSCIEEIRRVSHNLMPTTLQYSLKVALEDFAVHFPNVHFHFFGEEKHFDQRREFVIYCCAVELVNNSLRHSNAENINVQLIQNEKYVTLTVQDDGSGFNEETVNKGSGLKNIRDRVASCNGTIDIVTMVGEGTETTIELKTKNI